MKMRVPVVRVRMEATAAFLETTTRALAKLALLARTVKNVSVAAVLVASVCLVLLWHNLANANYSMFVSLSTFFHCSVTVQLPFIIIIC
jgi:hypothetical protein